MDGSGRAAYKGQTVPRHAGRSAQAMARRAVLLALVLALGGCGGAAPSTHHYAGARLAFDYPATWDRVDSTSQAHELRPVVFLSEGTAFDPCIHTTSGMSCSAPNQQLEPDGVAITWSANGLPGWNLAGQPGAATMIGGRPAKVDTENPGACRGAGGDLTITAYISLAAQSSWLEMDGCLRGPDLNLAEVEVARMLESVSG